MIENAKKYFEAFYEKESIHLRRKSRQFLYEGRDGPIGSPEQNLREYF